MGSDLFPHLSCVDGFCLSIHKSYHCDRVKGFSYDVPATSKNLGGTWTRQISNTFVNEFKATTQDLRVEFGGADPSFGASAIPKPADIGNTIASITFASPLVGVRNTSTALSTIGGATNIPQGRSVKVYQYADTGGTAYGGTYTGDLVTLKTQPDGLAAISTEQFDRVCDPDSGLAKLSLDLENVAAATYLSSIDVIQDSRTIGIAASIQPVEMQHAAILRFVLGQYPVPDGFARKDGARPPSDYP